MTLESCHVLSPEGLDALYIITTALRGSFSILAWVSGPKWILSHWEWYLVQFS